MAGKYECETLGQFEESLKRMRQFDNKILYALNTPNSGLNANSEVTEYESCAFYFEKFRNNCLLRKNFIIDCVGKQTEFVNKIKKRMEEDESDVLSAKFYSVASKKQRSFETARMMEGQTTVRSIEAFNKKCGSHISGRIPSPF